MSVNFDETSLVVIDDHSSARKDTLAELTSSIEANLGRGRKREYDRVEAVFYIALGMEPPKRDEEE